MQNDTNTEQNTWLTSSTQQNQVPSITNHQPVPVLSANSVDAADSYFDFDIPSSPVEDHEYIHLITEVANAAATTPQDYAPESGYVCATPISSYEQSAEVENSDNSSSDEPFFDPESSDAEPRSLSVDYYDCEEFKKDSAVPLLNGHDNNVCDNNSISSTEADSLPKSQSSSLSTACTTIASESCATIANDIDEIDFCDHSLKNAIANHFPDELNTNTNPITTNSKLLVEISQVREIPKYDDTNKSLLNVENDTNGNAISDDDEESMPRSERLRRCSSLKTGKTPPGTPGRKKSVRFADIFGLDLADVRTFMDEIPKIPTSAYDDLQSSLLVDPLPPPISLGQRCDKIIVPLFQQPGAQPNFLDTVQRRNVCLENAAVTDPICFTISGLVRVRNLDFHKSVHVRYTLDGWQSFSDLQAQYVENSCDGFSDKYTFTFFGNSIEIGQRIEIAIRFSCKGEQFWDNNLGQNYCFQCLPATSSHLAQTSHILNATNAHLHNDSWCGSSFY